mgnify:FL=1|jgi:magnesium and cobalt transporter
MTSHSDVSPPEMGAEPEPFSPEDESRPGLLQRLFGRSQVEPDEASALAAATLAQTQEMQGNLHRLQTRRVDDIAVPKADIIAIEKGAKIAEIVEVFRASTLTRLPVFDETLDEPLGLLHLKDFALTHGFGKSSKFDLAALVRPLIYAPPSMPVAVLLQRMQAERIHMALVIDEYGGVDGLITIEDILEEIVGDIIDEHDEEEAALWVEERPGVYLAQARAPLSEFEEAVGVDLLPAELDEEIDTLGGIVAKLTGRVPVRGEVVRDEAGHEFEVVDADPRRIKRLRITLSGRSQAAAE